MSRSEKRTRGHRRWEQLLA